MNDPSTASAPPPASRRHRLAQALQSRGLARAFLRARGKRWWPWPWLTVLVYHRVTDLADVGDLDPLLVDATPQEFERQMQFLRASFTPVCIDEVEAALVRGATLPPNPVLVTFDDGYRDNLEKAAPVLQRAGIRATIFVSTDNVSARRLFWWERIHVILMRATRDRVVLEYPTPMVLDLGGPEQRRAAVRQAARVVKDVFDLDLDHFLSDLARAAGVSWTDADERGYAERVVMRWEDVVAAQRAGMDVQSHTQRHRVLQTLTDAALETELCASRAELESRLQRPINAIAYPVGRSIADEPRVRAALARAGYTIGFTTNPGVIRVNAAVDRFDLDRIPVDRGTPDDLFEGTVSFPWLVR